jgi:anthranilate synthase component 1
MKRTDTVVRIVSGERFTPFALAKKLEASCLLESSSFQKGRERYSLLMVREAFRLTQRPQGVDMRIGEKTLRVKSRARDILELQRYFADQHSPLGQDFPFPAGGIGYLSYEFCRRCDTVRLSRKHDSLNIPEAEFLFGHVFVVFDHYTDALYIIGINYHEKEIDLYAAVDEVEARVNDMDFNYMQTDDRAYSAEILLEDDDRSRYENSVRRIREEIIEGNLLQAVPSRRLRVRTELPALEAYRRLRADNPSPYLFYLDFEGFELFGSSPEMHVKVRDGRVTIRPIAGTRRRGTTTEMDLELERELLADEKERAEHLMLVDLARNDIGRVCLPGSVEVTAFMTVERYSHVMHIVSQVEGTLKPGRTGVSAIRATFPAGTVSGAPKIRAIETVDSLEPEPRSFYAGLVGYMEPGGNMDTCIALRTAAKKDNVVILQAGAGVVFDSDPRREFDETNEKLGALLRAIGIEEGQK